jgi:hypothetical protein
LESIKRGDREGLDDLNREFERQRDAKLNRGLL